VSDVVPPLHGVRLIIAYDGTDFCGFQLQPDQRTVQGVLEEAIGKLAGHPIRIRGAGRTDAGVHALAQVVSFAAQRNISSRGWVQGVNQHLPDDVRIHQADPVRANYDPRFDAMGKIYRYVVQLGEAKNPLLRNQAWQLGRNTPIDLDLVREAAAQLVGTHDFRAFRSSDDIRDNSVRTIWSLRIIEHFSGDRSLLGIEVHGNAFMKNMVRIIAGTLLDIGRGRIPFSRLSELLGPDADRTRAGMTAPACGLTLVRVELGRIAAVAARRA